MIYGKNSKGNYRKLTHLVKTLPVFSEIENQRSMLRIDNFCELVRLIMDHEEAGLFFQSGGADKILDSLSCVWLEWSS